MTSTAYRVYRLLHDACGPQGWWPAESPFEVMVGAVLVQNTAWSNVTRAIAQLRDADVLEPRRLLALTPTELEELVRPAGYYRVKAQRLRNLLRWFVDDYDGDLARVGDVPLTQLREELLALNGIGPETADSILLYALERPVFVVDAYTLRIWARHGWIDHDADYYALQAEIADALPSDPALFNELHALLVRVGKDYCKKSRPRCDACPLRELLPPDGPCTPAAW